MKKLLFLTMILGIFTLPAFANEAGTGQKSENETPQGATHCAEDATNKEGTTGSETKPEDVKVNAEK